jgi:hypothetical protein
MKTLTLPQMTKKDIDNTDIVNTDMDLDNEVNDKIALKVVDELLDLTKLKTISRLKPEQISNIVKLYLFAETFKAPFTKSLADNILQLQISLNGYGRKELVQLVQQRANGIIEKPITSKDIFR